MSVIEYGIVAIIAFLAAVLSGTSAVGGAALMTVILTLFFGGELAVPILTIVMLMANLTRAFAGVKEIAWKDVGLFLLTSFPLSLFGALEFALLPKNAINIVLGIATIIFGALKLVEFKKFKLGTRSILSIGAISGFLSGFVGSSGTISAMLFFSLGLSPVGFVASEAAAVSILHIGKIIVYGSLLDIKYEIWLFAVLVGCVMIAGTLLGNRFIIKVNLKSFEKYVSFIMIIMGLYMIIF